jgi:hypothetical protein
VLEKSKLNLGFAALEPMKMHVDGFSASGLNAVVYDAKGCCAVSLHGGGWLLVTHLLNFALLGNSLACIDL